MLNLVSAWSSHKVHSSNAARRLAAPTVTSGGARISFDDACHGGDGGNPGVIEAPLGRLLVNISFEAAPKRRRCGV